MTSDSRFQRHPPSDGPVFPDGGALPDGPVLRCGLVGTGHWARNTHAVALASAEGIEFTAVWGRNPAAARSIADAHGARAYPELDAFLNGVDAVVFSVPPHVQSEIATRAAAAGKHLLLEKPIALTEAAADALVRAVEATGVASVVFFTNRFQPQIRAWLTEVAGSGSAWCGGSAAWLGSSLDESNPFNTPWRQQKGGLWDLGPHIVSMLWAALGPVVSVTADTGRADVTHLVLHHAGGASSTATVTLNAPPAADSVELSLWGETGRSAAPMGERDAVPALRTALRELADNARSGRMEHPCDVRFGRDVLRVLAEAERQVEARSANRLS
ncbi:MAG TPA: Gfo/Idh/MocA family oxidoreductase [Streptosporangiaceae bacterium]